MVASRALVALFTAGVVAMPFDGVPGIPALGELAHEGSVFFFLPALALATMLTIGAKLNGTLVPVAGYRRIGVVAAALIGCIALSALVNADQVLHARFHDRAGLPKMITSALVVAYGLALAWLAAGCIGQRWYQRLVVPVSVIAAICILVGVFERAAFAGIHFAPFDMFYDLIHRGADRPLVQPDGSLNLKMLELWDKRLRTVAFEPPDFGNFTGLAWPWLLGGMLVTRGHRRAIHAALLAVFSALIVVAASRTGWLLMTVNVAVFAALLGVFMPRDGRPRPVPMVLATAAMATGAAAFTLRYVLTFDAVENAVIVGASVSNLSRLAYQVAALRLFLDHPLFGAGLGQFAFNVIHTMPDWGYRSYEIAYSMQYPDGPWPNTYSLYARTAAELGVAGLVVWVAIWTGTIVAVVRAGLSHARRSGVVPWSHYCVVMSMASVLMAGVASDTYRTPLIWITLGVACGIIAREQAAARSGTALPGRARRSGSAPLPHRAWLAPQ